MNNVNQEVERKLNTAAAFLVSAVLMTLTVWAGTEIGKDSCSIAALRMSVNTKYTVPGLCQVEYKPGKWVSLSTYKSFYEAGMVK